MHPTNAPPFSWTTRGRFPRFVRPLNGCFPILASSLPPPYPVQPSHLLGVVVRVVCGCAPPQKLRSQFVEKLKENESEIEELVSTYAAQK